MDPTIQYIIPTDSFSSEKDKFEAQELNMFNNQIREEVAPMLHRKIFTSNTLPPSEYITTTIKEALSKTKKSYSKYDPITWNRLRKEANPFELHGSSIFINRAAIKLANIDAIYGLTPNYTYNYNDHRVKAGPIPTGKWSFADIAGGPGSFSQYLLFRMNGAVGYGITLADPKDETLGWNREIAEQINVIVGEDKSGDIIKHAPYFGKRILELNGEGVDLAVADGAIGSSEEDPKQETDNFLLIMAELLAILLCVKEGGRFVCKIFEAENKATAQMIYLMSLCFEYIDICKPIASRPANSERYLVGINRVKSSFDVTGYFQSIVTRMRDDSRYISRILDNELPEDFGIWLKQKNDTHADMQTTIGRYIEQVSKGIYKIPKYNMYKAYSLWNIPDNQDDKYKIVRKNKSHFRYNAGRIEDIDTLLYKELHRYTFIKLITEKIANQIAKYYDRSHLNLVNATRFLSMYLLDHLTNNEYHTLDPVFPSGNFHKDERYYSYLTHTSKKLVNEELSKEWFLSLKIRDTMNHYANKLFAFGQSKIRYNIKKKVTNSGIKYSNGIKEKRTEFTITQSMDTKLNNLLEERYKDRAKEYIFLLLLRYYGNLNSGNHQLGLPDYETIRKIFNIKEELFASPFNCSIDEGYHSAFPDTDAPFRSLGKFVDTVHIPGNGYSVNPPHTDVVMELAMEKVVEWLNTIPNLIFYITIPVWRTDYQKQLGFDTGDLYASYPALDIIEKSGFIKKMRLFHKDTFTYKNWNTGAYIHASNTHIILAANRELTPEELEYIDTR